MQRAVRSGGPMLVGASAMAADEAAAAASALTAIEEPDDGTTKELAQLDGTDDDDAATAAATARAERPGSPARNQDALSALAAAAVSSGNAPTTEMKPAADVGSRLDQWFDVGFFRTTQTSVQHFFVPPEGEESLGEVQVNSCFIAG